MAKLKEVRALKSSGVEPLAPTLIKRILHNLVLKAEDRRWASEIGRLSMLGELTPRQTSAAYHVGEIYGRFEWLHGRRRSAASPSYEIERGRGLNGHDHSQDATIEADFTGLLREIPERPRELAAILEGLCTEDQAVPPGWMDLTRGALEHLDAYFRQAVARARRGRRRVKRLRQCVQVVALRDGKHQILSTEGIAHWLEAKSKEDIIALSEMRLSDALAFEPRESCIYLKATDTVDRAREVFRKDIGKRIFSALVSEHASPTEKPINIVTPWDFVAGALR